MFGLVIVLVIIAAICIKIRQLSFMKKLAAKIVLVYVMLGWVALCIWTVVFGASELYENRYDTTREERRYQVQRDLEDGDIEAAMFDMYCNKDYDEEFEYAWERGIMYRTYNQYSLFSQAGEVDSAYVSEAEKCREKLLQICADSTCPENELYVEYYQRELQ